MTKRLTVSELSNILGVSVNTTWKKIKKKGLNTLKESVNNRVITVVELAEEELNSLINEQNVNNPINNGVINPNYEENETLYTSFEPQANTPNSNEMYSLMEKVMDYSKDMNEISQGYMERIIHAETQVRLLEDSEGKNKNYYHEINAENKQLKEQNLALENKVKELEEKLSKVNFKWWNKKLI